ncbi:4'-phosphopantetheinyl transferase family protein [Paucihalobacter sp.]|uniref:4'-phosphopantetheinyl transferase family protein n=1 Tax=Paucihalobacter sp. TaxID=2850405 RepID=UPI002FE3F8F3
MIGNDIVSLDFAKNSKNWKNQRFLDKLFTKTEQNVIKLAQNPFVEIWKLWSLKESAYKLYVQRFNQRFYAPIQFECNFFKDEVTVSKEDFLCNTKTLQNENYVFSIAFQETVEVYSDCIKLKYSNYKYQSATTTLELKKAVSKHFNIAVQHLNVCKSEIGIPKIYFYNQVLPVDISLSHHGHYGAFSLVFK